MESREFGDRLRAFQQHVDALQRRFAEPTYVSSAHVAELQTMLAEMRVQNETLAQEHRRYRSLFESAPDAYLMTSTLGTVQDVNRAAVRLLGVAQSDLVHSLLAIHLPPEERCAFQGELPGVVAQGGRAKWILNLRTSEGATVPVEASVATALDGPDVVLCWLLRDIRERVDRQGGSPAGERASAEPAERLSVEADHRIKNNLAMISGLLGMQALGTENTEAQTALREAAGRVHAFAAIHNHLCSTHGAQANLLEVLRQIADGIAEAFPAAENVAITVSGQKAICSAGAATNLAVVANELVTNALKHGARGAKGVLRVRVRLQVNDCWLTLSVWGSGSPITEGFDVRARARMGLRLIQEVVVDGYGGEFSLVPSRGGTRAEVVVPMTSLE